MKIKHDLSKRFVIFKLENDTLLGPRLYHIKCPQGLSTCPNGYKNPPYYPWLLDILDSKNEILYQIIVYHSSTYFSWLDDYFPEGLPPIITLPKLVILPWKVSGRMINYHLNCDVYSSDKHFWRFCIFGMFSREGGLGSYFSESRVIYHSFTLLLW